MEYGTSIFDNIQTEDQKLELLDKLKNELFETPSLNRESFVNTPNEFLFVNNESMIQAEFYHQCKIKNIECHLEVQARGGRLDAVIKINNIFIMIEFKILRKSFLHRDLLIKNSKLRGQIKGYKLNNYPLVLITDKCCIQEIIMESRETFFDPGSVYYYCTILKKLSTFNAK